MKRANRFRIGILVNPPDEAVDLEQPAIDAATNATQEDWERDRRGRDKPPKEPAGRFLRQQRAPSEGLLILYPLNPDKDNSENGDVPIVGFVLSFPAVEDALASRVTYTVNNVYQQDERMDR